MQNNISNLISEQLKQIRLNKGFSVEDVSSALNIRKIYIKFLEGENVDIENLPTVYVIGYLKMYAKYLELDVSDNIYGPNINDISNNNNNNNRNIFFYLIVLLFVSLTFGIYFIFNHYNADLKNARANVKQEITFSFKAKRQDAFIYILDNKGSIRHKYFLTKDKKIMLTKAENLHAVVDNPNNIEMYICDELYTKELNKFINLNKIYKDQLKLSHKG
jgi:hypothetical protein